MKLIINIPAFNEETKIAETIKKIPRKIQGFNKILIQVIDDGSSDKTVQVAKEAGADFVYSHETNRGIGIAFRTSVEKALENDADYFVNIDADGQFNPDDIAKLLKPILNGKADLVSADRFGKYEARNMPKIKNTLNRFAASIIGNFLNYKINDLTCGFRAYNRETLLRLNLQGSFTYTQEVIIDAIGKNLKVMWIPVKVSYFSERKSRVVKSVFRYVNNSFRIILKAVRDVRPMKFFGIPSLILIIASLLVFIAFIILYIGSYFQEGEFQITPFRNYLFFATALFIIGIQFLVFALLADMIKSNRRLTEDQMYLMKKEKYKK